MTIITAKVASRGLIYVIHVQPRGVTFAARIATILDASGQAVTYPVFIAEYLGNTAGQAVDKALDAARTVFEDNESE